MTWGPWIEWRGEYPAAGQYIQAVLNMPLGKVWGCSDARVINDYTLEFMTSADCKWESDCGVLHVIRYRIRKPKGLTLLEEIAKNPERELEYV